MFETIYYKAAKSTSEDFFDHVMRFQLIADCARSEPKMWKKGSAERLEREADREWARFCDPVGHGYGAA